MSEHSKTLRVILGNQLFPLEYQDFTENEIVFMAEDFGLCTYVKHHKAKIPVSYTHLTLPTIYSV